MGRWTIYCHTHTETGRRYIGLTGQTVQRRWSSHVAKSKSARGGRWHFPNAIKKYGSGAFFPTTVMVLNSLEEANAWEEFWIEFLDTRNPERGFNLAPGGRVKPHTVGRNPWGDPAMRALQGERSRKAWSDPQLRADLSSKLSGRELSDAHRSRLSEVAKQRGVSHLTAANLGRKHTPEHIAKVIAAKKPGRDAKRASRTHYTCARHGVMLLSECGTFRRSNGTVSYRCRACCRARTNMWKKAKKERSTK